MIDYFKESGKFKPNKINVLLVGEAPPPSGKKYFYKVPDNYKVSKTVENDTSLPGTIFNHFFNRRPKNPKEYKRFLEELKSQGVFLIDMYNEPIRIRDRNEPGGINNKNLEKIFSDENMTDLKNRIDELSTNKTIMIFLLARNYRKKYKDKIKITFPDAKLIRWKKFRMKE
jgi:hypothetical protein